MNSITKKLVFVLLAAAVLGASAPISAQGQNVFHEDFTTTALQDSYLTNLDWSTAAGEIRLAPFPLTDNLYWNTSGSCADVTVAGGYAYVADSTAGLRVLDVRNPNWINVVGTYNSPGTATAVDVQGNYAYLADGYLGLKVVDITNPATPTLVASLDATSGTTQDIIVDGNLVYLACYTDGFQVLDVSNPAAPVHIDSFNGLSSVIGLHLEGDLLYVADNNTGLWIFDVSDPLAITMVGMYDTPGNPREVFVEGNTAYVADRTNLIMLDVTNPAAPALLGSKSSGGYTSDVFVVGQYAYVADFYAGLALMDVSNPASVQTIKTTAAAAGATRLAVSGEAVYVAAGANGLFSYHASSPIPMSLAGGNSFPFGYREPVVEGHLAYFPCVSNGVMIYDISDPNSLSFVGMYREDGLSYLTYNLAVQGDYAFVADYEQGFLILDVSDPTTPSLLFRDPDPCFAVAVEGNVAFTTGAGLCHAYDIRNPAAASETDGYNLTTSAWSLAVDGKHVFAAVGYAGIQVLEYDYVGESFAPVSILDTYEANDVLASGDIVFVADGSGGVKVLNVSNPALPVQVGSFVTAGSATSICLDGTDLYVSEGYDGIQRLDVRDPASPTLLDAYDPISTRNEGAAVWGDYLVAANYTTGFSLVAVNQRRFNAELNQAGSLVFNAPGHEIIQARILATQVANVAWALSSDGGFVWDPVSGDGTWSTLSAPALSLRWLSTHSVTSPRVNPSCSDLQIEWLYDIPEIATIGDVPGDQGLQVSLAWRRSGYDHVGSAMPIIDYSIYRKIEGTKAQDAAVSGAQDAEKAYPPGDWHFVMTVPADAEDNYAVVVPTLGDSTIAAGQYLTTFFVRARTATPGVYYDAAPVAGYSVDNLAPSVPAGLKMQASDLLAWDEVGDVDFRYFTVYNSDVMVLDETAVLVGNTTGLSLNVAGHTANYLLVTATDFAGNESEPAVLNQASGTADGGLPTRFALHANYPNPFNPATVIRFELAAEVPVSLRVFDVSGRLVRTLVDGRVVAAGRHEETWDGLADSGTPAAAGVYLYRLQAGDFSETMRMTLVK